MAWVVRCTEGSWGARAGFVNNRVFHEQQTARTASAESPTDVRLSCSMSTPELEPVQTRRHRGDSLLVAFDPLGEHV